MTIWVLFFSQTYSVFQESKLALVQEMTSTCRRKVESRFLNQWWTRPMTQIYSICNCSDVSSTEAKRHVFVLKVSVNIGSRNDLLLFAAKPFLFYNRWWLHIIKTEWYTLVKWCFFVAISHKSVTLELKGHLHFSANFLSSVY